MTCLPKCQLVHSTEIRNSITGHRFMESFFLTSYGIIRQAAEHLPGESFGAGGGDGGVKCISGSDLSSVSIGKWQMELASTTNTCPLN